MFERYRHQLRDYYQRNVRRKHQPGIFVQNRAWLAFVVMLACFACLGLRAIYIHLAPSASVSLARMANQQYQQIVKLSRYRGVIYDRRREPLAISIRVPSLYVNPRQFKPTLDDIKKLSQILDLEPRVIRAITRKSGYFAWLKRKCSKTAAAKVSLLNIRGIAQIMEPSRFYPAGSSAANLLGYVGLDDRGLSGLEQQYDDSLGGEPLQVAVAKDARGRAIVAEIENAAPEKSGDSIELTIDRAIQEIAERALQDGVKTAKARGGMAIVADPHTGRILALANNPTFDPNNQRQIDVNSTKNQALMNVFEPGSVIKPLVVALAMEKNLVHEKQTFDCENGALRIGNRTIHDAHPPKTQFLTTEEVVMHSSNVCTYKIAKLLGSKSLYLGLKEFGIGRRLMRSGFPGEGSGQLSNWEQWAPVRFANIAFGQGLTLSAMELVQAYGALANGGKLMRPILVDRVQRSDGRVESRGLDQHSAQVIKPRTALRMRQILARTINEAVMGAKLDGYTAGGKTGTAQKVDPKTRAYSHTKHLASFIGMAPIADPHLVVYVQIDEPNQPTSYGSLWAAPVFKDIMEKSLAYLNVARDLDVAHAAELQNKSSL